MSSPSSAPTAVNRCRPRACDSGTGSPWSPARAPRFGPHLKGWIWSVRKPLGCPYRTPQSPRPGLRHMSAELHLGVDVGGTNTDAVILDQSGTLLARAKVSTRPDIRSGIERAVDIVLAAPGVEARRVRRVMVGTTHAANAILQRRALQKVAVIRLGAPLTMAVPPLSTWPADLRAAISVGEVVVAGGCDYDGEELAPLDREE